MKKILATLILLMLFQAQIATQTTYANFNKTFISTDLFPVASSITGYVYNELTHIIENNGLATRFECDAAGRQIKTYSEVIDGTANGVTGGFKLRSVKQINYKNL